MGSICNYKQKDMEDYKTIKKDVKEYPQSVKANGKIKLTTILPNNSQSDCLLIFTDTIHNFEHNQLLIKIGGTAPYQINSFLNAHLKDRRQFSYGDCVIFDIDIEQLKIKKVAVLCMEIWMGSTELKQPIEEDIQNAFEIIKQNGVESLFISNFNDHLLGIPPHVSSKALARVLCQKNAFKQVVILCDTQQSEEIQKNVLDKQKARKNGEQLSESQNDNANSTYF